MTTFPSLEDMVGHVPKRRRLSAPEIRTIVQTIATLPLPALEHVLAATGDVALVQALIAVIPSVREPIWPKAPLIEADVWKTFLYECFDGQVTKLMPNLHLAVSQGTLSEGTAWRWQARSIITWLRNFTVRLTTGTWFLNDDAARYEVFRPLLNARTCRDLSARQQAREHHDVSLLMASHETAVTLAVQMGPLHWTESLPTFQTVIDRQNHHTPVADYTDTAPVAVDMTAFTSKSPLASIATVRVEYDMDERNVYDFFEDGTVLVSLPRVRVDIDFFEDGTVNDAFLKRLDAQHGPWVEEPVPDHTVLAHWRRASAMQTTRQRRTWIDALVESAPSNVSTSK